MTDVLPSTRPGVQLDGGSLTVDDVAAFARGDGEAALSAQAQGKVRASRELKQRLIESGIAIYGVTTGFGDSAHYQISPQKARDLQRNLLRFLGAGTGPIAPRDVLRATVLLRCNCLAKGNSGVRLELVERILHLLNNDVLPMIPERGSCGASGDLVPLSYLGAAVVGEREVLHRGEVRDTADVLAELGLEPFELESKEGLAITNGTSFTSAFGVLAVKDAEELAFLCEVTTAMASEALLGNRGHFADFLSQQKPHPGQMESMRIIRELLAQSGLSLDSEEILAGAGMDGKGFVELHHMVQDKYSIRCAPHVTGALRDTVAWVRSWMEIEINASDDNPLFDVAEGRVRSGGNFYASHPAQAMDALKVALANVCDLMDRQLELVVDEKFNVGLTPNLIPRFADDDPQAGMHHGFKGMQLCCSAMAAEAIKLSNPASVHSRSTECHNQDKVSMGTIAARDARTIVELAQNIAAVHLIAVCQALDLRGLGKASAGTRTVHGLVRERVPFLDADRRTDLDIAAAVELIRSGALSRAALAA